MTEPTPRSPAPSKEQTWPSALRRGVASVRLRIVVGYVVLLATALAIAVVVTRQVQLARADREFEREQAQEVEELRNLAEDGVDPETLAPFAGDLRSIFRVFLERNVPSDDEAFYTIVDGAGYLFSNASPDLFEDPQFLPLWSVATPTPSPPRRASTTSAKSARWRCPSWPAMTWPASLSSPASPKTTMERSATSSP